jgi:hypothetical protein
MGLVPVTGSAKTAALSKSESANTVAMHTEQRKILPWSLYRFIL